MCFLEWKVRSWRFKVGRKVCIQTWNTLKTSEKHAKIESFCSNSEIVAEPRCLVSATNLKLDIFTFKVSFEFSWRFHEACSSDAIFAIFADLCLHIHITSQDSTWPRYLLRSSLLLPLAYVVDSKAPGRYSALSACQSLHQRLSFGSDMGARQNHVLVSEAIRTLPSIIDLSSSLPRQSSYPVLSSFEVFNEWLSNRIPFVFVDSR